MFKRLSIILVVAALLTGCSVLPTTGGKALQGSRKIATRDYALDGFTGIDASAGFKVTVSGGSAFKVTVTTDDNILDVVSVRKEGSILHIGIDPAKARSFTTTRLEAAVTLPALESVALDAGSQLTLVRPAPQGTTLTVIGKAGSQADLGAMPVQKANVTLEAGSKATVNVSGQLDYKLSAGSQLRYTGSATIGSSQALDGSVVTKY
jgi:hypothetical protein